MVTAQSVGCHCTVRGRQKFRTGVPGLINQSQDLLSLSFLNCKMRGWDQKTSRVPASFDILSFNPEEDFMGLFDAGGT